MRRVLARLAVLKTGCGLNSGAVAAEIDGGEVQAVVVESRLKVGDLGAEPVSETTFSVDGDANLVLNDGGVNLNRTESGSANPDMHLDIVGGGWNEAPTRWCGGCGWCRVQHLLSFRQFGCLVGLHL